MNVKKPYSGENYIPFSDTKAGKILNVIIWIKISLLIAVPVFGLMTTNPRIALSIPILLYLILSLIGLLQLQSFLTERAELGRYDFKNLR